MCKLTPGVFHVADLVPANLWFHKVTLTAQIGISAFTLLSSTAIYNH